MNDASNSLAIAPTQQALRPQCQAQPGTRTRGSRSRSRSRSTPEMARARGRLGRQPRARGAFL